LPDAFAGTPFSYSFTPLNNTGAVTFAACGSRSMNLPPGMTLSPAGVLSGMPAASGSFQLNFSISDSNDTVCFTPTLSVYTVQITSPGLLPHASQYLPYAGYTLAASGGTPGYTFSSSGLPSGLTMSPAGVISGTPTNAGPNDFTVTVTDSNNVSYTKYMTIPVDGEPPYLPNIAPYGNFDDCSIGTYCSRPVSVFNGGLAPYTWTVTGLPDGMSARAGSGTTKSVYPVDVELFGVPLQMGSFPIHLVVTDATGASAAQDLTLRVRKLGIDNWVYSVPTPTYNVPYSYTYRLSGGTGPYSVQVIGGEIPHGITATGTAQGILLNGTPIESGPLSTELLVTDAVGNTLQVTLSWTVNNAPGTTVYLHSNWNVQGPFLVGSNPNLQFSACCVPSYTWTLVSGALPPGTTFSSGGLLSGVLTTAWTYGMLVEVQDQSNPANYGYRYVTVVVTNLSVTTSSTLPSGNVGTYIRVQISCLSSFPTLKTLGATRL